MDNKYSILESQAIKFSKISFVFSIIWLAGIGSIIGITYGIKALKVHKQSKEPIRGKSMAIIGIVLGSLGVVIWVPILLIGLYNSVL